MDTSTILPALAICGFFLRLGATSVARQVGSLGYLPVARRVGYGSRVVLLYALFGVLASAGAVLDGLVGSPVAVALAVAVPSAFAGALVVEEFGLSPGSLGAGSGCCSPGRGTWRECVIRTARTLPGNRTR